MYLYFALRLRGTRKPYYMLIPPHDGEKFHIGSHVIFKDYVKGYRLYALIVGKAKELGNKIIYPAIDLEYANYIDDFTAYKHWDDLVTEQLRKCQNATQELIHHIG